MKRSSLTVFFVLALAVAMGLSAAVSPYASSSPDGLEKVAEEKGFLADRRLNGVQEGSPIPDYAFPGIGNARVATGLAGFTGTLVVATLGVGIAYLVRRRRASNEGARTLPGAT